VIDDDYAKGIRKLPHCLILGDCLEVMKNLLPQSIDAIIADLPYGSTHCEWDQRIDLEAFWKETERLIRPGSPVVLFADMRFAVALIASNPKWFRYDLIWDKVAPVGFLDANRRPLRSHELILIFSPKSSRYRPQKWDSGKPYRIRKNANQGMSVYSRFESIERRNDDGSRYPLSIVRESNANRKIRGKFHPTQKPVALMSYLIKTFTDPGMCVLDPTMGSGSTGLACLETGRSFIGIERDPGFFEVASQSIKEAS
jgi:DNA modification methylase